jgi:hypothetical protein
VAGDIFELGERFKIITTRHYVSLYILFSPFPDSQELSKLVARPSLMIARKDTRSTPPSQLLR